MAPNELVILRQLYFLNEQHSIFTRLPCLKWQMVQYATAIAPYGLCRRIKNAIARSSSVQPGYLADGAIADPPYR